MPMRRRTGTRSASVIRVTSSPPKRIVPESGSSNALRCLRRTLLPVPDRPRITRVSPRVKAQSGTAWKKVCLLPSYMSALGVTSDFIGLVELGANLRYLDIGGGLIVQGAHVDLMNALIYFNAGIGVSYQNGSSGRVDGSTISDNRGAALCLFSAGNVAVGANNIFGNATNKIGAC